MPSDGAGALDPLAVPEGAEDAVHRGSSELAYQPALDGLRAVAVLAVLGYHGGVSFASGGFLGVEAFFVLSGFLITSLLVADWHEHGTIRLGAFWARRARRLLPALFALLIVVAVHQAIVGSSGAVPGLFGDGIATLFYVGNWHQIATGSGYFAQTAVTSPLQHTWSLAIEEQFYLVWPLVLLGLLRLARRRARPGASPGAELRPALYVAVAGALASAAEMAWLYGSGSGLNRVYYGTDTRAQGVLVGAALAIVCSVSGLPRSSAARRAATAVGTLAFAAVLVAIWLTSGTGEALYRGGFLAVDLAVAATILCAVACPASAVARVLSLGPLRAVGKISYGLYLWHYPIFLWLTEPSTGISGWALFGLRLGVSIAVATVSYFVIEQPIRHRRLVWRRELLALPLAVGAVVLCLVVANAVPATAAGPTTAAGGYVIPGAGNPSIVGRFATRHPARVLFVGDSIGLTFGVGLGVAEARYGVEIDDKALLGCGFSARGEIVFDGVPTNQAAGCERWPQAFAADVASFHPQVAVVEMGFWDCYDHLWNGQLVHLGEPTYDAYVMSQIVRLVQIVGSGGRPVVLLTVPPTDTAPLPNGSPEPANSPERKAEINAMLAEVADRFPHQVHLVDLDRYVAPGGRYTERLFGVAIRTADGIHFTPWAGLLYEKDFLPYFRELARHEPATLEGGA